MEERRILPQAFRSYRSLIRSKNIYNTWLLIKLFILVCLVGTVIVERYYDIPGVVVSADRKALVLIYSGLGLLILSAIIRLVIVNCEKIPGLSNIHERMEQREFRRLKTTYQYQLRVK
jgi:hypothetical protein